MFDSKQYVNGYIKDNYKTIKVRVRKDDRETIDYLSSIPDVNKYILSLIRKEMENHRSYQYIDPGVQVDFPLSKTMEDLVLHAEKADLEGDYGAYSNYADAIDSEAKREVTHGEMSESEWKTLMRRYPL